jgi:hypothetical protein
VTTGSTHSASLQPTDFESFRIELREVKLKLEKLNDEVAVKSNIKDVCALVDLKANLEDVDKTVEALYKELQVNCAPKIAIEQIMLD